MDNLDPAPAGRQRGDRGVDHSGSVLPPRCQTLLQSMTLPFPASFAFRMLAAMPLGRLTELASPRGHHRRIDQPA